MPCGRKPARTIHPPDQAPDIDTRLINETGRLRRLIRPLILWVALFVGTMLASVLAAVVVVKVFTDQPLDTSLAAAQWALPLLALVIFLIWRRREARPVFTKPASTGRALGLGLAGFAGWIAISVPVLAGLGLLLDLDNPGGRSMGEAMTAHPSIILYAVIGAPLGEELLFRRMGYRLFLNRGFPLLGALITSISFAAIHLQYFQGHGADVVVYPTAVFVMSLGLSWLYAHTGRLLAPLAAHVAINAFGVAIILLLGHLDHL